MQSFYFEKAQPVWAAGRTLEKNCELAFRTVITPGPAVVRMAASTLYRLWINGNFIAAGPARTAHGFYSVDEYDVTDYLKEQVNVVVIEVVGYNINTFDTLNQPSFLTAEVLRDHEVIAYTGGDSIQVYDLKQRVQRVQRYSYQRAFAEAYHLQSKNRAFYIEPSCTLQTESCAVQEEKSYLKREVRVPRYEVISASSLLETGSVEFECSCTKPIRDRSYTGIGNCLEGFRPQELEEQLSEEGQNMVYTPFETLQQERFPLRLCNGYGLYNFAYNATGFLKVEVECKEASTVYILFDEILSNGAIDFLRLTSCNCFKYSLDAGKHQIMTFAPYTMKYVQVAVKGIATIEKLDMVEYKHPPVAYKVNLPEDEELKLIYDAALETYLANAVDVFTDCPSRERAGWLCDSFFLARVEHVLTGESMLERSFLENFLLAEEFQYLPKGMLPMCYPADHYNGNFIPNWAMWFVLELEEYYERTKDGSLIEMAKKRVYDLLDYFQIYENRDGLLEGLKGWVFVEWSRANDDDVVQKINFPTNMMYVRMLQAAAKLYGDETLAEKAKVLRKIIRERSRKGLFFTDNEMKIEEEYVNPENRTEVCQYYAFFTGVATIEEDYELWEVLRKDFGYQRKETGLYPEVSYANAFIGNYLRIELLYREKQFEEMLDNIRGYFLSMAKQTGTLWEHDSPKASCNHGFAAHIIYWLAGIYQIR